MRHRDTYQHFKGGIYFFEGIAIPKNEAIGHSNLWAKTYSVFDAHTPDGEDIIEIEIYNMNGVMFIDRDDPHVIYQSEKDEKLWARKVDDFFGYKMTDRGRLIKRFEKK